MEGRTGLSSWETIRRCVWWMGLWNAITSSERPGSVTLGTRGPQHISVITREPGPISRFEREVHQPGSRKQREAIRGRRFVTWCPGFAYQHFNNCQVDNVHTRLPVHAASRGANLAYRKLMIILWKGIKIKPVATWH